MKKILQKAARITAILLFIVTAVAYLYSLYLILYYFDIVPNRHLGFLDISHLISGIVAGAGTVTGLLGFLLLKLSKKKNSK